MIDSQRGYNHLIYIQQARLGFHNCFIKNNQEIVLDLTQFAFQEQPDTVYLWLIYHGGQANQIPGIALYHDPGFNNTS